MNKVALRNKLLREASRIETLQEINEQLIPELAKAMRASFVFAYRGLAGEKGIRAYLPPSTPDLIADYFREYAVDCPLRRVKEKVKGPIVATTALYSHRKLLKTRVYNELWRPWGFDHHVALRFDDPRDPETASLGVMINRDHRRGEYTDAELRFLRSVMPSLTAAARRAAKTEILREKVQALEALVEAGLAPGPKIIFDADGFVVHAVVPAHLGPLVAQLREKHHPVRLASLRLLNQDDDAPVELVHRVGQWQATLHRAADKPLVIAALEPLFSPLDWASFGLTRSEGAVLKQLLAGQSNTEIGRRLFISPETVRTHLTRIYKKLGARSRLEAVVKARVRGSA